MFLSWGWTGYNSRREILRNSPATVCWPEYNKSGTMLVFLFLCPFLPLPLFRKTKYLLKKTPNKRKQNPESYTIVMYPLLLWCVSLRFRLVDSSAAAVLAHKMSLSVKVNHMIGATQCARNPYSQTGKKYREREKKTTSTE